MRKILEDLYFGNITPNEQKMAPGSELKKALDRVVRYENQLTELLDEDGQTILTKLTQSQEKICQGGISPSDTPPHTGIYKSLVLFQHCSKAHFRTLKFQGFLSRFHHS